MKIAIVFVATCILSLGALAKGGGHSSGSTHSSAAHTSSHLNSQNHEIRGYTKKDGTYVAPSHATNPNATTHDNYTHKGNVNPYTGKEGDKP